VKPLTLGTAGHIDHGKTRLVEALTGTNTDRLPEEQERGISIALGYAPLDLPGGRRLSVIDVPGHERFVRTMVAGATGIDLFLLVVDAGEGPRPQTREHLEILRLLGVDNGVAAVTKIDAVEPERVRRTLEQLGELVPAVAAVPVSAVTGAGLPDLLAALERTADDALPRVEDAPVRLYADRVFSLPGAGTVVTGTLWSGTIGAGDELAVLPAGFEARVRSVQVHGESVARADPGQRVAVSLVAERRRRITRGDVLVAAGAYGTSYRLDVALEETAPISDGARVLVSHGTSAIPGRVVRAGAGYAQLRLERPVVAARGDHVVLRAEMTLGGGRVLDPDPPRHSDPARMRLLTEGEAGKLVAAPIRVAELRRRGLGADGLVQAGEWVCSTLWLEELGAQARSRLAARNSELDPGLAPRELLGDAPWAAAIEPLLELDRAGGKLYLSGRRPSAGEAGKEFSERLAASAGFEPVPVASAQLALQLEREGRLVRLGDGRALSTESYERAKALLVDECEREGTISLARYRDLLGASRRVAQLLLERLDADRVTLRVGDERRLRRAGARRT
jgi:selenocysteine-specific elongation factor